MRGRVLKLLYVALAHDAGDPARGRSYEHWNFYEALRRICAERGWELFHFCPATEARRFSRVSRNPVKLLNERLALIAERWGATALFHVPAQDGIEIETIKQIRASGVWTIGWRGNPEYSDAYDRCVPLQWAVEPSIYTPTPGEKTLDVFFAGSSQGVRGPLLQEMARSLRAQAPKELGRPITLAVCGMGWLQGRVSQAGMVRGLGQSRICLNVTNAESAEDDRPQQVKRRHFEIASCGGFQFTQPAEGLDYCFEIEGDKREIQVTQALTGNALAREVLEWLQPEKQLEAAAIAQRGRERVLHEHTWEQRLLPLLHDI